MRLPPTLSPTVFLGPPRLRVCVSATGTTSLAPDTMKSAVLTSRQQQKIVGGVVPFVVIYVMNMLIRPGDSSKLPPVDEVMLVAVSPSVSRAWVVLWSHN